MSFTHTVRNQISETRQHGHVIRDYIHFSHTTCLLEQGITTYSIISSKHTQQIPSMPKETFIIIGLCLTIQCFGTY